MVNAMALSSKYKKFASTQNSKNTLLCIFDGLKRNDSERTDNTGTAKAGRKADCKTLKSSKPIQKGEKK